MVTAKENRKHIWFALLLLAAIAMLIIGFNGCIPTRQKCLELYPQQYKDTIITTHDTIITPFIIQLPGDTIKLEGKIDKPCPDSLLQWAKFTAQINHILNKDYRLKQLFELTRDSLKLTVKTKEDTVKVLNKIILIQNDKIRTQQQAIIAYQNKVPSWAWWVMGVLLVYLLGSIVIKLIKK